MTVKNLKEWEERVRKAMEPPATQGGQGFSPNIQRMRQTAKRRPIPTRRRPPAGRF